MIIHKVSCHLNCLITSINPLARVRGKGEMELRWAWLPLDKGSVEGQDFQLEGRWRDSGHTVDRKQ